jgi:hypothetical protein
VTTPLNADLPDALLSVATRPLFVMHLNIRPPLITGVTPAGFRRVGIIPGGSFEGQRLSGLVLDGGSDWQSVRSDGATTLDVRLMLKTSDDALIGMTYRGIRHGPREVIERMEKGEPVDPSTYYFRIVPSFETSAPQYDCINRVVAVGIGHRGTGGAVYGIFEVL